MEYREHIERVIEYIEENLQGEISLAQCARVSGYSSYHFIRVFKDTVGLTPADYIRKRRISEISREIMQGNRNISDIAFRYGFNSKENFIRAFKTEHHILPTEYKKAQNSLKLYQKFCFVERPFSIVPRILEIQPFFLTVYTCDEESVPNFWNKYNARGLSLKLSYDSLYMFPILHPMPHDLPFTGTRFPRSEHLLQILPKDISLHLRTRLIFFLLRFRQLPVP